MNDVDPPGSSLQPESAAEMIWLVLSFLALPLGQQRAMIEGLPPAGPSTARLLNADLLALVVESHFGEWQESFAPTASLDALLLALARLSLRESYSNFLGAGAWHDIKALAATALHESGLGPWRFEGVTDLEDLVEVHDQTPRSTWPA